MVVIVMDKIKKRKIMTKSQESYKKNLIQKIQINKYNIFVNDEERKAFMKSRFGVNSTKDMTIDNLKLLLDFCLRKIRDIPILNKIEDKELITQAQVEKIRILWKTKAKDKSEAALLSFAFKVTKYKLTRLDNLLKGKATKLIVALTNLK